MTPHALHWPALGVALLATSLIGACVKGTDDGGEDIGAIDAVTETIADGALDASAGDAPDADAPETADAADAADTEVDAGCTGCLTSAGCVALTQACPDDDAADCLVPKCLDEGGGPTCTVTVLDDGTSCGASGCGGTCANASCELPPEEGCNGLNLVFVTRDATAVTGGLGTLDQFCADQAALNPDLPTTTWKAWASVSAGAGAPAATRLGEARAFIATDGFPVAQLPADVAAGQLLYPPLTDQFGDVPGDLRVATGTLAAGSPSGLDCGGWNDLPGTQVTAGWAGAGTGRLNEHAVVDCTEPLRILCFQVQHTTGTLAPTTADDKLAFVSAGSFDPASGTAAADALCQSPRIRAPSRAR